jgi:hypothetical protein
MEGLSCHFLLNRSGRCNVSSTDRILFELACQRDLVGGTRRRARRAGAGLHRLPHSFEHDPDDALQHSNGDYREKKIEDSTKHDGCRAVRNRVGAISILSEALNANGSANCTVSAIVDVAHLGSMDFQPDGELVGAVPTAVLATRTCVNGWADSTFTAPLFDFNGGTQIEEFNQSAPLALSNRFRRADPGRRLLVWRGGDHRVRS